MWLDDLKEWTQLETYTDIKKTAEGRSRWRLYVPTRHVNLVRQKTTTDDNDDDYDDACRVLQKDAR